MLTFPSGPHYVCHPPQGLGEQAKVTLLLRTARLHSTDFFQIPQNPPRTLPVHDVIHIPKSYLGFLFWHLWMTHPPCARAWTPALMLHLSNPCAKRKILSLTKPKGKIYKTKIPRPFITFSVDKILLPGYVKWSTNFRGLHFQAEIVLNTWTDFCLSSHKDQCRFLHTLSYASDIRLTQLYLREAFDHVRRLCLYLFFQDICFLSSVWNNFLL